MVGRVLIGAEDVPPSHASQRNRPFFERGDGQGQVAKFLEIRFHDCVWGWATPARPEPLINHTATRFSVRAHVPVSFTSMVG